MIAKALKSPSKQEQKLARENLDVIEQVVQRHQSDSQPVEFEVIDEKTHIKIPPSALRFLNTILKQMAQGKAISVIPSETEVSTQQAAEILNVSRPHVVKLVESGEIPYHKVGTHRRIKLKDIERYKQCQDKERRKHLSELAKQAQELDMGY
jgi:excisionase family DNA binding protein